jgi:hypothetical protein
LEILEKLFLKNKKNPKSLENRKILKIQKVLKTYFFKNVEF